eukprot:CAMPEP_0119013274 /NCGR_PEP_ID=MMETSP1176-20130426/8284_1 /TAXON_ID=265551 /ORGANISM="Synedropsis recta cf, Strain CCMP1620" /LENGTH=186 /DNA_ID=CAMNT_0006966355 /DNA_START=43 /DNA_END=603 /DNA_ORIENTATION=+
MSLAPAAQTLRRALVSVQVRRNISVLLGVTSLGGTTVSLCEDKSFVDKIMDSTKSGDFNQVLDSVATQLGSSVQGAVDSGVPTQLSYGFVSGYCSGLALKKAGRAAAVVFGMGFVVLQTLQYSGYIQVDHGKLKKGVESLFDLDGDGDVDEKDANLAYTKVLSVLQYNMPAGGGFGAGFVGGLRSG